MTYGESTGVGHATAETFQDVERGAAVTVVAADGTTVGLGWVEEVLITTDSYVVYLTREDRPSYGTWADEPPGFNSLWLKLSSLHSAIRSHSAPTEIREVSRQIGGALSIALEGEGHVAHEFLDKIAASLEQRRVSRARRKFSLATFITAAICVTLGALSIAYLTPNEGADSENLTLFKLLELSLIGGAIGTFLATNSPHALRTEGSTTQDWPQTFQYGSMRTLYGIGSAFVLLLAVTSKVISSSLLGDQPTKVTLLLVACAAGFLDHWVRDVLTGVGGSSTDDPVDPGSLVLDPGAGAAPAPVEGKGDPSADNGTLKSTESPPEAVTPKVSDTPKEKGKKSEKAKPSKSAKGKKGASG